MAQLPPELIASIVDHLHGDAVTLKACTLVSHTFLPIAQAHIFESIELRLPFNENTKPMRRALIPALSHTRKLSISHSNTLIMPSTLDKIFDHFKAFRNVRQLVIQLDTFDFVDCNLRSTSRYFSQFQPTLRSLDLTTSARNPKDVIAFITFFPSLEELSLLFYNTRANLNPRVKALDPNLLTPLRGTLRLHATPLDYRFITELTKVRVLYHTLELGGNALSPGMGISELVVACAPTLRILKFLHYCWSLSSPVTIHELNRKPIVVDRADLDSWMTFAACTQLTEIRLPVLVDQDEGGIKPPAALISTICSPHLQKIVLSFDGALSTRNAVDFSRETWGALENVLLELTRRSRNVIQLVLLFQDRAQLPHHGNNFMSRFLEVGEVRFELSF